MKFPVRLFSLLPLFGLLAPGALWARPSHFTLLFTNDQLGQVGPAPSGDPSKPVGGVTRRMALIEKIRKEVGPSRVFLVDGGNLFTGKDPSDLTKGEVDCAAYKLMGYDAVVLGEHDFDEGEKALQTFEKDYHLHWVSANCIMTGGQNFMQPYVLRGVPGLRIGIIGFSNADTPQLTDRENVRGLTFYPPTEVAKGLHSILKKDADFFIALTHEGLDEDKKLAKENPFLHVIVGGFSQDILTQPLVNKLKDGTLQGPMIVQAGSHGLYLGRLDLTVDGDRKHGYAIQDYKYQLIPITADLPEDPQMKALLAKFGKAPTPTPQD